MDHSFQHHASYIGRSTAVLPTPSFIISKPVIEANIKTLHDDVEALGIDFRPHTKTLKTIEATRMMLKNGKYRKVVCSTVPEIIGCLPLAKEGILDECIFGMPIFPSIIPRLQELSKTIKIDLLLDNEAQIPLLKSSGPNWDVWIKIDVGARRAGLLSDSSPLAALVKRIELSAQVTLRGFYCHANHSYNCRTPEEVGVMLKREVDDVLQAAALLPPDRKLTVSIGATPTAHVIGSLKAELPSNVQLELHAGNFPTNDLQQVSTGLVTEDQQAVRVCTEVVSIYPDRNEVLINAGVIVLAREVSAYPGFGKVVDKPDWSVVRVSQEHGVLGCAEGAGKKVEEEFKVGQKVFLWCQHSCITAAAFYAYYVVDEEDVVRETWAPWKGW